MEITARITQECGQAGDMLITASMTLGSILGCDCNPSGLCRIVGIEAVDTVEPEYFDD